MKPSALVIAISLMAAPASAQSGGAPAAAATGPTMAASRTDSLALARRYAAWFYTGQSDSLWAHQSADVKQGNTTPAVDP